MRWLALGVVVLAVALLAWDTIAYQRHPLSTIALPDVVNQNRMAYLEREALIVGIAIAALLVIAFLRARKP